MPPSTPLNRDTANAPPALELPEIPVLKIKEADKEPKIELNKIVQLMNNLGPIRGEQRAGRKRKQAQRQRQEEEEEEEALFVDEDLPGKGSSSHEPPRPPRRRVAVPHGGASTLARAIRSTRSATRSD